MVFCRSEKYLHLYRRFSLGKPFRKFCHTCNNFYCAMCDQAVYMTDTRYVQKTHIHFRSMFRICT